MRFVLEACVDLGISATISIKMMEEEQMEKAQDIFAIALAFLSQIFLLASPIYYGLLAQKHLHDLKLPDKDRKMPKS